MPVGQQVNPIGQGIPSAPAYTDVDDFSSYVVAEDFFSLATTSGTTRSSLHTLRNQLTAGEAKKKAPFKSITYVETADISGQR